MEAALEAFERDGCCVVPGLDFDAERVAAVRRDLEPWADRQLSQPEFWRGEFWEGAADGFGRAGVSNVLFEMADEGATATHTLEFMLHPELLKFATAAFRTAEFKVDDASIAAYPRVGEAGNRGAAARGGSDLHGWHRDSFNYHALLRSFHCHPDGSDAVSTDDVHAESARGGAARAYSHYGPPSAINFLAYLQDSVLRIVPGSHRDFTEIDGGFGPELLDHISSLKFGEAAGDPGGTALDPGRLSARVLPHPREACFPIKRGQVVAFHNNILHCGMLNNSLDERRLYLSSFFTRPGCLGAYSRNLSERLMEYTAQQPDHPLSAVLRDAAARRDEQVLRIFGAESMLPPDAASIGPGGGGDPFDFLRSLVHGEWRSRPGLGVVAQLHKDADDTEGEEGSSTEQGMRFLTHVSAVESLLSSWGCDQVSVNPTPIY